MDVILSSELIKGMENMKMKKEIKDYMHLYINSCECEVIYVNGQVKNHIAKVGETVGFDEVTYYVVSSEDIINVKLILRPLSSMTEEEAKEYVNVFTKSPCTNIQIMDNGQIYFDEYHGDELRGGCIDVGYGSPETFKFLLSKGFDLFGLHEAGLCIYKDEIK